MENNMKSNQKPSAILFQAAQMVLKYRGAPGDLSKYCCQAIALTAIKVGVVDRHSDVYSVSGDLDHLVPGAWYYFSLFRPEKSSDASESWFNWGDHPEHQRDMSGDYTKTLNKIVQNHRTMSLLMAAAIAEADGN